MGTQGLLISSDEVNLAHLRDSIAILLSNLSAFPEVHEFYLSEVLSESSSNFITFWGFVLHCCNTTYAHLS